MDGLSGRRSAAKIVSFIAPMKPLAAYFGGGLCR
jgi:hypothetical protein